MGKRNVIFALVLITLLGGIALALRIHAKNHFSSFQQLPDGSFLRLGRVEFSKSPHTFRTKTVTGWKAKVARFLPEDWKVRLGWLPLGGAITMSGGIGTNLCVFTIHEGPVNSKSFDNVRLVVFDELGNSFDVGGDGGTM